MSGRPSGQEAVEAEVAALDDLDLVALRERWQKLFGNPPPRSLRHAFLVQACAYGTRIQAFGGLSAATRRRLRRIAAAVRSGKPIPDAPKVMRPGTRLIRAWGGKTHTVGVTDNGFQYDGRSYRSLSAIARTITGTNWNGHTFFGLKKAGSTRKAVTGAGTSRPNSNPAVGRGAGLGRSNCGPNAPAELWLGTASDV